MALYKLLVLINLISPYGEATHCNHKSIQQESHATCLILYWHLVEDGEKIVIEIRVIIQHLALP